MTQAQTQRAPRERAELAFKRHILETSSRFEAEPVADMYRVNLLGQMLDRYEDLKKQGLTAVSAIERTKADFADIHQRMLDFGLLPQAQGSNAGCWPQMTEDEAAQYLKEHSSMLHKRALGVLMCVCCLVPLFVFMAFFSLFGWRGEEIGSMLGVLGMFGMIGTGVYSIITAGKPKDDQLVKSGRYSFSVRLRQKLRKMREMIEQKSQRRKGKAIAMLVTCVIPVIAGGIMTEFINLDLFPLAGCACMFAMIGSGVYQLIMASGEKQAINKLTGLEDSGR